MLVKRIETDTEREKRLRAWAEELHDSGEASSVERALLNIRGHYVPAEQRYRLAPQQIEVNAAVPYKPLPEGLKLEHLPAYRTLDQAEKWFHASVDTTSPADAEHTQMLASRFCDQNPEVPERDATEAMLVLLPRANEVPPKYLSAVGPRTAHMRGMTTMTPSPTAVAARESARAADGRFGAQRMYESLVELHTTEPQLLLGEVFHNPATAARAKETFDEVETFLDGDQYLRHALEHDDEAMFDWAGPDRVRYASGDGQLRVAVETLGEDQFAVEMVHTTTPAPATRRPTAPPRRSAWLTTWLGLGPRPRLT